MKIEIGHMSCSDWISLVLITMGLVFLVTSAIFIVVHDW